MKKLLSILAINSIVLISSSTVISCNKSNGSSLSLDEQHNYIIDSINKYENQKNTIKINDLNLIDVIEWKNINCQNIGKNQWKFIYDISTKPYNESQNYISEKIKDYKYLSPEVKGNFILDNNAYKENNLNIITSLNKEYNFTISFSNLIVGSTKDFITIFNADDWSEIHRRIDDWKTGDKNPNHSPSQYINELGLKSLGITDEDWKNSILPSLAERWNNASPKDGYSFLMHIVNKKVIYTNLKSDGSTNMPFINDTEDIKNSIYKIDDNNHKLYLNKDILFELKDMYNYKNNLWNNNAIESLINDRMWFVNSGITDSITNFKLLFENKNNLNIINNILNDTKHNNVALNIANDKVNLEYAF